MACTLACTLAGTAKVTDSCSYYRAKCDSLEHASFILYSQVDWVQYYLALMQKRQKDTVYSKGWLIRAVANKLPANPYMGTPVKKQVHKSATKKTIKKH